MLKIKQIPITADVNHSSISLITSYDNLPDLILPVFTLKYSTHVDSVGVLSLRSYRVSVWEQDSMFFFFFQPLPFTRGCHGESIIASSVWHMFYAGCLPDATLTIYLGLGPALEIHWLPSGLALTLTIHLRGWETVLPGGKCSFIVPET